MINQQLFDYIKQQLQQGAANEDIKAMLRSSGWPDADIEDAFSGLSPASGNNFNLANKNLKPKAFRIISVVFFLTALLELLSSAFYLLYINQYIALASVPFLNISLSTVYSIPITLIILGILNIIMGIGLWRYKNWGRLMAIIFSSLIIIYTIYALYGDIVFISQKVTRWPILLIYCLIDVYLLLSLKPEIISKIKGLIINLNKKTLSALLIILFVAIGGGTYLFSRNNASFPDNQKNTPPGTPALKQNVTFEKIFEISTLENASPRGYIDLSTSGKNFWVTDKKLAFIVTYLGANNSSTRQLIYDGKTVPFDSITPPKSENFRSGDKIGGKITTVKQDGNGYSLIMDGKVYEKGKGSIREIVDYNGTPAYVLSNVSKDVIMYKGKKASKEYLRIGNLKVIGGKLAYGVLKELTSELDAVLVWGDKEYSTRYDSVVGYVDSLGIPAYTASNFLPGKDKYGRTIKAQYLVRGDEEIFTTKPGEEGIDNGTELIDVAGNPAVIVRNIFSQNSYVYYAGKKNFEGYKIYYIRELNGKLAVLVEKDKTQSVFVEK